MAAPGESGGSQRRISLVSLSDVRATVDTSGGGAAASAATPAPAAVADTSAAAFADTGGGGETSLARRRWRTARRHTAMGPRHLKLVAGHNSSSRRSSVDSDGSGRRSSAFAAALERSVRDVNDTGETSKKALALDADTALRLADIIARSERARSRTRFRASMTAMGQSFRDVARARSLSTSVREAITKRTAQQWLPAGESLAHKVYLLFSEPSSALLARVVSIVVMLCIIVSCASFVVESMHKFRRDVDEGAAPLEVFVVMELVAIVVFTIEYLARLLTVWAVPAGEFASEQTAAEKATKATLDAATGDLPSAQAPGAGAGAGAPPAPLSMRQVSNPSLLGRGTPAARHLDGGPGPHDDSVAAAYTGTVGEHEVVTLKVSDDTPEPSALSKVVSFVFSPLNLLDLIAVLPFYIELALDKSGGGFAVLRVLRLARVFRVFKLGKYSSGMQLLLRVFKASAPALYLLVFFVILGCLLFGTLVFFAEEGTYDPATGKYLRNTLLDNGSLEESPFTSIPAACYWTLVTATTVGYGDMYPTSSIGRLVAVLTMHAGILVLALPITVIGANFAVEYSEDDDDEKQHAQVHGDLEEDGHDHDDDDDDDDYGDGDGSDSGQPGQVPTAVGPAVGHGDDDDSDEEADEVGALGAQPVRRFDSGSLLTGARGTDGFGGGHLPTIPSMRLTGGGSGDGDDGGAALATLLEKVSQVLETTSKLQAVVEASNVRLAALEEAVAASKAMAGADRRDDSGGVG